MKVTLDREGKNVVLMGLELESEKALQAYEKACRNLSKQVNIPGFRKGKAPRNIIEKSLGVDYIKREALELLVPELLGRVIRDENLDVITQPEIDSCEFELGSPLKLHAKFEVRPEVTLGEYSGISIKVAEPELPASAVDDALKAIADSRASLKSGTPRAVVEGDMVLLDFECFVDGNLIENGKAESVPLEVKEGNFLDGFCQQLVGKEPGQQFDVNVKFPPDYRNKELANKDANFKVDLREIREKQVPEINDELAQAVGQENLEKLKEALVERLGEEVRQQKEINAQRGVVEAVVKSAQVDIPETMVERERDLLLQQARRYVEQNNESWESFEQSPNFENIRQGKYTEARQRVLTSLILGAVVRAEQLTVDDDEIAPYLAEIASRYNLSAEQVARNDELRRQVMEEVLTNKVVQLLVAKANIEYVPESQMPKPDDHSHEGHDHHHHDGEHHDHEHHDAATASGGTENESEGDDTEAKKGGKKSSQKTAQKS